MRTYNRDLWIAWAAAAFVSSILVGGTIVAVSVLHPKAKIETVGGPRYGAESSEVGHPSESSEVAKAPATASHQAPMTQPAPQAKAHIETKHAQHNAHWSYEGEGGPAHWDKLNPAWETCRDGRSQSPVNIDHVTAETDDETIEFDYRPAVVKFHHNGHTVQGDVAPGSWIQVAGVKYKLLQFHFHTPSEHMLHGERSPGELHFVHQNSKGDLAVVGIMLEPGIESALLSELWEYMPTTQGKRHTFQSLDVATIIPNERAYYHYDGSLTTPPCSENVRWMVLKEPMQASRQQLAFLRQVIGENARPIQILHGRSPELKGSGSYDVFAH